jgi:hypothetical protein
MEGTSSSAQTVVLPTTTAWALPEVPLQSCLISDFWTLS